MELRYYQREAINAVLNEFKQERNALVELCAGSGKSVVIAGLIKELKKYKPYGRVLMVVDSATLVAQNVDKIYKVNPELNIGTFSASLKEKNLNADIVCGTIQSLYKKTPNELGVFEILCIDEAHMISPNDNTIYRTLIKNLQVLNPRLRICGLTATPFRMDTGMITDGDNALFDRICYSFDMNKGIKEGFLSPLISQVSKQELDLSGVKISRTTKDYDIRSLDVIMSNQERVQMTVHEALELCKERKHVLWFCSSLHHIELIKEELITCGEKCEVIIGSTSQSERTRIKTAFEHEEIKHILSCDALLKGFDCPCVDCLVCLAPTKSTGRYIQEVCRGDRKCEGKINCLVLDFANLIATHGAVNDIKIEKKINKETNKPELEVVKIINNTKLCLNCRTAIPIKATECPHCHYIYTQEELLKHDITPSKLNIMEDFNACKLKVDKVFYKQYTSKSGRDCLKIDYLCDDYKFHSDYKMNYNIDTFLDKALPRTPEVQAYIQERHFDTLNDFVRNANMEQIAELSTFFRQPKTIETRNQNGFNKVIRVEY